MKINVQNVEALRKLAAAHAPVLDLLTLIERLRVAGAALMFVRVDRKSTIDAETAVEDLRQAARAPQGMGGL